MALTKADFALDIYDLVEEEPLVDSQESRVQNAGDKPQVYGNLGAQYRAYESKVRKKLGALLENSGYIIDPSRIDETNFSISVSDWKGWICDVCLSAHPFGRRGKRPTVDVQLRVTEKCPNLLNGRNGKAISYEDIVCLCRRIDKRRRID